MPRAIFQRSSYLRKIKTKRLAYNKERFLAQSKVCEKDETSEVKLCPKSIDPKECHNGECFSNCELYRAELELYKCIAKMLGMEGYEGFTRIIELRLDVVHELSEFKKCIPNLASEVYKSLLEKGIAKEKIDVVMCQMTTVLFNHFRGL